MDALLQLKLKLEGKDNHDPLEELDTLGKSEDFDDFEDSEDLEDFDDLDDFDVEVLFRQVLVDNGLDGDNEEYRVYSTDNKGCNKECPFVINTPNCYVELEKMLVQYLFIESPIRHVEYNFIRQSLSIMGDVYLDKLTFEVTDLHTSESHIEEYWFNITSGILSIGK